jgi:hypothetical protein
MADFAVSANRFRQQASPPVLMPPERAGLLSKQSVPEVE